MQIVPDRFTALGKLIQEQLNVFPEHSNYLHKRFSDRSSESLEFDESTAKKIVKITGEGEELITYCNDYKYLTEIVLEEEIYFRRHREYRLKTFSEAEAEVYSNRTFMTRYMNGLLLTQLWWHNHSNVLRFYCDQFLSTNPANVSHLEIGPGHGLYLYLATTIGNPVSVTGWDISPSSVELVQHCLDRLGCGRSVNLQLKDMFEPTPETFGSVTFSEVLEHLEDPEIAMKAIANLLEPEGRVFIHAPVNSPAPDHLTLFRKPEEVVDIVSGAGLEIIQTLFAPTTTASSLKKAREREMAISVAVIARKTG